MAITYQITNTVNGKFYIGVTTGTLKKRWAEHRSYARTASNGSNTSLCRAIRKYGEDVFEAREICHVFANEHLAEVERFVIAQRKPEYNQTMGGEVTQGRIWSDDKRREMSETKQKLYRENAEYRVKILKALERGRLSTTTPEANQKRRTAMLQFRHSDETKARMSQKARLVNAGARFNGYKQNRSKAVQCLNDGLVFTSAKAADIHYGFSYGAVWKVAAGKCRELYGRRFMFVGGK